MAKVLKHTPERPLTELEFVEVAVAFANGIDFVIDGQTPVKYAEGSVKRLQEITARHLERMIVEDPALSVEEEKARGARGRAALARELLALGWGSQWGGVVDRVIYQVPGGLRFNLFERLFTAYAVADRGVAILLDPSRGFGEKLCRCRLSSCRIFFLEKRPEDGKRGRTLRRYCSTEHRDEGHEELARIRYQRAAQHKARKAK